MSTTQPLSQFQRSLYDPHQFTLTFELVPSRGGHSKEHTRELELAGQAAADHRLSAVSITENAGGYPALSPEILGLEIKRLGLPVIIHFSCKDKNRNQIESMLFAWNRMGLHDLLVITGDYPQQGYFGCPKPVFDLDCIHLLDLLKRMNHGIFDLGDKTAVSPSIEPTSFFKGVAFSPFKRFEAELLTQYYKLHRKIANGGDYIITQIGFDARKFHEIIVYLQQHQLNIPILGNVFIPNLTVTEKMYQGKIPGCIIPERLYNDTRKEAESPDKGKKARLIRAAKLLAILKGMGYSGAHIGGPGLDFADIDFVLNQAVTMDDNWQDFIPDISYWLPDSFYYFTKNEETGLNLPIPTTRPDKGNKNNLSYMFSRYIHNLTFQPTGALYRIMKKTSLYLDDSRLQSALPYIEHLIKFMLFECRNCGDCTLGELAFLCPQSGCAKYLLNGPCGGSRDGWCEVHPNHKRCLYVLIYERLKTYECEAMMGKGLLPPRDWVLNNTSSWVNFYRGRDHTAKKHT